MTNSIGQRHQVPLREEDGATAKHSCEFCGAPSDAHGNYEEPIGTESQRDFVRNLASVVDRDVLDGMILMLRICNGCTHAEIAERIAAIADKLPYTEEAIRVRMVALGRKFPAIKRELNPKTSKN